MDVRDVELIERTLTTTRRLPYLVYSLFGAVMLWDAATEQATSRGLVQSPLLGLAPWSVTWAVLTVCSLVALVVSNARLRLATSLLWLAVGTSRGLALFYVLGSSGLAILTLWVVAVSGWFIFSSLVEDF